jgi:ABC-type bacteriocin/lantibiotic exporter with double-glycine peptidase domain
MAQNGKSYGASSLKRLFSLINVDKKEIFYIYFYAIFSGIIALTLPLGVQAIIGIISSQQVSTSWFVLIVLIILGLSFSGILKILQQSIIEILQQKLFARAAFEFAYRIPRFKMDLLHKFYPPELVNRFFDVLNIQKGLEKVVLDFTTAGVQVFFSLLILAFYHPLFVFFGFIFLSLLVVLFRLTFNPGVDTSIAASNEKYEMAAWLEELARTMGTFKLSGSDDLALNKTNDIVNKYISARQIHFRIIKTQLRAEVIFKIVITATFLVLGGILVVDKQLNIGQFVAAEIIVISLTAAVEKAVYSMSTVFDTLTALEKVGYVTDIPIDNDKGVDFTKVDCSKGVKLSVKNLGYNFSGQTKFSLNGVSFELERGEKICISGLHGSGKSTLIDLLCGFYESFEGELSFNDIPVRNIKMTSLQRVIGDNLSQQDIFKASLKDNLTMGKDVDTTKLVEVCNTFGLMDFIKQLEKGFETMMDPEGRKFPRTVLSKIILARSIIKEPKILILDDFLTNLEGSDKEKITNWLFSEEHRWTIVVSSNDSFLAKKCDKVLIMENGKEVFEDTFENVTKQEKYKSIFY